MPRHPARGLTRRPGALVVRDPAACPACGADVQVVATAQTPLLHHGGYGAARRHTVRWCPCGWDLVAEVAEVRP